MRATVRLQDAGKREWLQSQRVGLVICLYQSTSNSAGKAREIKGDKRVLIAEKYKRWPSLSLDSSWMSEMSKSVSGPGARRLVGHVQSDEKKCEPMMKKGLLGQSK